MRDSTVTEEFVSTLDLIFGINPNKSALKEIELKDLKNPSMLAQLAVHREPTVFPDLPMRRTASSRSLQLSTTDESRISSTESESGSSSHGSPIGPFNYLSLWAWRDVALSRIEPILTLVRMRTLEADNELYYSLQNQPFSAGIYLRGMLSSGLSHTIFHMYRLVTLEPLPTNVTIYTSCLQQLTVAVLVLHVILNMIGIPFRICLHYQCWCVSRSYDTEGASQALQDLMQSDLWTINRVVGFPLDLLSLVTLLLGQIYLWIDNSPESFVSAIIIDMCATNFLTFLIRALVAVVYFVSFMEVNENSNHKRRGGLSNFDLSRLPTFVYASKDEVVNDECSICLTQFELGEMLISLPCHARHSFHANCIRQWLHRQNVCPLCQQTC